MVDETNLSTVLEPPPRWKRRPEGSNWGEFGPNDQIGRLNLITPGCRRKAAEEVREGLAFCLSLPLDVPKQNVLLPTRHPPRLGSVCRGDSPNYNYAYHEDNPRFFDVVSDDFVTLFTQYSTQWDALSHIGRHFDADNDGSDEKIYYNGYRAGVEIIGPSEGGPFAKALGVETMAETGLQGRGVLLDLERHLGRDRQAVGYDDLIKIMDTDSIVVEPGDILCLHTGFARALLEMGDTPDPDELATMGVELDGRDPRLLEWIDSNGIAALVADNFGVELIPARQGSGARFAKLPLHEKCLFKLGLPLGELWYLSELAGWLYQHHRSRFLLTAPPLRLPGAVGSPVTPVATV